MAYYGFYKEIDNYLAIYQHLKQYEDKLKKRGQVRYTSSGKPKIDADYPGQHHWLELDNNPRKGYMDDFDKRKILYSEIVRSPQFYLDIKRFVPEATTFIISGEHLDALVQYLNSSVVAWIFKTFYAGGGLGEDGFRYKKQFLINLPIPRVFNGSFSDERISNLYHFSDEEMYFISSSVSS